MRTPIQEAEEYVLEILKKSEADMGTYGLIELKFRELRDKEKEAMVDFAYKCRNLMAGDEFAITHWYDKTFNKEDK